MHRDRVSVTSVASVNTVEPARREFLKGLLGAGASQQSAETELAPAARAASARAHRENLLSDLAGLLGLMKEEDAPEENAA